MNLPATTSKFESAVLENLDAANNLARWLTKNDQDALDVVQESCMKALRAYESLRGGDFRPWFLTIVRNTSYSWLRRNKGTKGSEAQQRLDDVAEVAAESAAYDPQAIAIQAEGGDFTA